MAATSELNRDIAADGMAPDFSDAGHSRVFKMGAGRFAAELIFRYSWIWLLGCSLLAVAGIVLGVAIDLRWLVVALMIVFIVIPFVLAFLYYFYGLRRECYVNTLPHRIMPEVEGLKVRLYLRSRDEDEERTRIRDEFFPYSSMSRFVVGNNSAVIPLRRPMSGFLWIPADAFTDKEHLANLLRALDRYQDERSTK